MRAQMIPLGLALSLAASLLGLLFDWLPPLDLLNHFRPYLLVALIGLAIVASMAGRVRAGGFAALLAVLNAGWLVAPMRAAAFAAPDAAPFKIISFNVWSHNTSLDRVAEFLIQESADVVVLQEVPKKHRDALIPRLRSLYPHVLACDCKGQIMLAKRAWNESGSQPQSDDAPPLVWAKFDNGKGGSFRIVGLHPAYPLKPWLQARHYEWGCTARSQSCPPRR